MKKISYFLVLIIIVGGGLVSFWIYKKYFQDDSIKYLTFTVERGDIQESVRVRGDVISQKTFDLEFPFSGIVERIYVKEGQKVQAEDPLMKLKTTDYELEAKGYQALIVQKEATLTKILAGATAEDIKVYETKVANAKTDFEDAEKGLTDKIKDAYTKSDDAIRNRADQLFTNPLTTNVDLSFFVVDAGLADEAERERLFLETNVFPKWKDTLAGLGTSTNDISTIVDLSKGYLNQVKSFLETIASIVNNPNNSAVTTVWKESIYTARTNVNTATTNLIAAVESYNTAKSVYTLSQNELDYKKAGSRTEDVAIAKAQIDEARSQLAMVREKINKSTLKSPVEAKVIKIWPEKEEMFTTGTTAISLYALGYKVTADITELDIAKINEVESNNVNIKLDAFPEQKFSGKVLSVEPQVIIKDGDKYYRVNVGFDTIETRVRSGMSADLVILTSLKENILKIPALAINERDDQKYVLILENGKQKEISVITGITDGDDIEIISGLNEGQQVIISTD
jgi:HlyD family secretion protein